MLFNSWEYVGFLGLIVLAHSLLSARWRTPLLLTASYWFYIQWDWRFSFLIAFITLVNFEAGRRIALARRAGSRRAWLAAATAISLGVLGLFKYFDFFADSLRAALESIGMAYAVPHVNLILPVGISFFTFQALSYTIDVYRGAHGVEPSFAKFALYVSFFPQLVAGPIERATTLLDQFGRSRSFEVTRFAEGSRMIIWGLFKKVVIADRLSVYVDSIYEYPELHDGSTHLLAAYFFAFQIYCDFSAYSDIAIGSARILGYDLMKNFNLPYLAHSISEFWRRWHISLTSWFTSYVYIPLGGNRVSVARWVGNVLAVFLLSGLWHGANWTFVFWGALHASYYFIERCARGVLPTHPSKVRNAVGMILTFHAVVLAWVFFRAESVGDAWLMVSRICTDLGSMPDLGPSRFTAAINFALIIGLLVVQVLQAKGVFSLYFSPSRVPAAPRAIGYAILLCATALLGASSSAFIYFQF